MQSTANVAVTLKCRAIEQADTRLFNYNRFIITHHHTDYDVGLTFEQPSDNTLVSEYVAYKKVNQSRYRPGVAQRVPGS
jgi:hypothetical protein